MPVIPIEKVGEIQKLLTLAHDDSSHALKLIERMGSRFHDYKNIFHEINPWLTILRDTAKQNIDMVPTLIESLKNHSALKVQAAQFAPETVFLSGFPHQSLNRSVGNSFL